MLRPALLPALLLTAASFAPAAGVNVAVRDTAGRPVADAVVSLTPLGRAAPPLPAGAAVVIIAQRNEEFVPYVTAVQAGTRIDFPNRDSVQHHVYSLSPAKRFELPLYRGDPGKTILFDRPGVVVLGCNIHDWMIAYVVVLATPYFAKSGADGRVALTDVPPGRYRLDVWHPRLAPAKVSEVTLPPGGTDALAYTLTLQPDRRIRRAPGLNDSGYR